jgi:dsDNA-binding SOS-regulon protein
MKATYTLQTDLDKLGEWVVENAVKINLGKRKAVSFMRAQMNDPLNYFLGTKKFWKQQLQIFRNNLMQQFKLG